jgi:hypothetical protein
MAARILPEPPSNELSDSSPEPPTFQGKCHIAEQAWENVLRPAERERESGVSACYLYFNTT